MIENSNVELQLLSNFSKTFLTSAVRRYFSRDQMNMFRVFMRCLNVNRIGRTNFRDHTENEST